MLKIYAIKDVKIGFMNPFYLENDEVAIRTFKKAANDMATNSVNDFPEDKELWCLGSFDTDTGIIEGGLPKFLVKAIDCIVKAKE